MPLKIKDLLYEENNHKNRQLWQIFYANSHVVLGLWSNINIINDFITRPFIALKMWYIQ